MAYVYRHIRLDKNEPFYIGIGSDDKYKRANSLYSRNQIWKNISRKTDYRVDIIADNLSWYEACAMEKELISIYGRIDLNNGTLANMTIGGDGIVGLVITDEHRQKLKSRKVVHSEETRRKIGLKSIGRILSPEARLKISIANRIKKMPEHAKVKISAATKGENNPNAKIILDLNSGVFYGCCEEAANSLNMTRGSLTQMLNGRRRNKTNMIYV